MSVRYYAHWVETDAGVTIAGGQTGDTAAANPGVVSATIAGGQVPVTATANPGTVDAYVPAIPAGSFLLVTTPYRSLPQAAAAASSASTVSHPN